MGGLIFRLAALLVTLQFLVRNLTLKEVLLGAFMHFLVEADANSSFTPSSINTFDEFT